VGRRRQPDARVAAAHDRELPGTAERVAELVGLELRGVVGRHAGVGQQRIGVQPALLEHVAHCLAPADIRDEHGIERSFGFCGANDSAGREGLPPGIYPTPPPGRGVGSAQNQARMNKAFTRESDAPTRTTTTRAAGAARRARATT
jgi:hypothetical protein